MRVLLFVMRALDFNNNGKSELPGVYREFPTTKDNPRGCTSGLQPDRGCEYAFTSQSGVSRHIRELEDELGIEIFVRRGKRLLGMTERAKHYWSLQNVF